MDSYLRTRFLYLIDRDLEAVEINRRAAIRRVAGVFIIGAAIWNEDLREYSQSRLQSEYDKAEARLRSKR